MKDVVVRFFNMQGVLDHLQSERFSPESEEEWYIFQENESGSLTVYRYNYQLTCGYSIPVPEEVARYAAGRWAEAEYE